MIGMKHVSGDDVTGFTANQKRLSLTAEVLTEIMRFVMDDISVK